jgi:5-(aminomethyl)-3-furanmethanol phosphate kinase
MCTVVYKLGGSLLDLPDISRRLHSILEQPFPFRDKSQNGDQFRRLLVVGGGSVADAVRRWDKVHDLGDDLAHRLAMQSMSFNAELVAAILGEARVVATRIEARDAWAKGQIAVLAAAEFVDAEERASQNILPRSWHVTSDSVAAYVAIHWPAAALALLKSVPVPAECSAETAAKRGFVDAYFPQLAGRVPRVGWVNLRADDPTTLTWLESGS